MVSEPTVGSVPTEVFSARPRSRYRILAVSDKVEPRIYGPNLAMVAANIDFVVACGDLPYYYLEYIISVLDRPLYYVHGNHDRPEHRQDSSLVTEPPGGINLHRRVRLLDGLLIAGLQGSHRYNQNPHYQYTQTEMRTRVIGMMPELLLNRIRYGRALDLLVTHSPPFGITTPGIARTLAFKPFIPCCAGFGHATCCTAISTSTAIRRGPPPGSATPRSSTFIPFASWSWTLPLPRRRQLDGR